MATNNIIGTFFEKAEEFLESDAYRFIYEDLEYSLDQIC